MIRFENVGLRYGVGPEVLRDLSFDIGPKSFQFLTGPSGAGKTSLLKMIYLAQAPTLGRVSLFGESIRHGDRAQTARLRTKVAAE